jgi:hypothetical protein
MSALAMRVLWLFTGLGAIATACGGNDASNGKRCGAGTTRVGNVCYGQGGEGGQGGEAGEGTEPSTGAAENEGGRGEVPGAGATAGIAGSAGEPSVSSGGSGEGGNPSQAGNGGAAQGGEQVGGQPTTGAAGESGSAGAASECEALPEICDNGLDENCDGFADEGCSCAVVGSGEAGSLRLPGNVVKLAADPARCLAYALSDTTPSELFVLDTGTKQLLQRLQLPDHANDFDMSSDGAYLAVAGKEAVWSIDPMSRRIVKTLPFSGNGFAVEVGVDGAAYYAAGASSSMLGGVFVVDLESGALFTTLSSTASSLELAGDEQTLFLGSSFGGLERWELANGSWSYADRSEFDVYFSDAGPTFYLTPAESSIYAGAYRFRANELAHLDAISDETIFAEDSAARFAIGQRHVIDVETSRDIASLPHEVAAAMLLSDDRELWYFDASFARLRYVLVDDLFDANDLGVHERPARAWGYYNVTQLIADPKRDVLYGLDRSHQLVLTIDRTTLVPSQEIAVAPGATDFDLDSSGDHLLVSHDKAAALTSIDLDSGTFDALLDVPLLSVGLRGLSGGRFVLAGAYGEWMVPIVDGSTGEVLETLPLSEDEEALAVTNDGSTLFVAASTSIYRFDVTTSPAALIEMASFSGLSRRWAAASPDGSGLFLADGLHDGDDLGTTLYPLDSRVFTVTPNGELATTFDSVLRVSDGVRLGALATSGTVQCLSPDGHTLYVVRGAGIAAVSLAAFE